MLLQSLLRPVLTPLMRGMFDAPIASSSAWSPLALWPDGISSAGMWISPRDLTSQWQDYTGTTPVVEPGTVADSSNPVGLALDIRAGATVLTDPGNHMSQSTSAARPLLSARVNLLTYSEDFSNAAWYVNGSASKGSAVTDPLGGNTGRTITATGSNGDFYQVCSLATGPSFTNSVYIKRRTGTGTIQLSTPENVATTIPVTSEWQRFSISGESADGGTAASYLVIRIVTSGDAIDVAFGQIEPGPTATTYQRVGAASDYDSTGFPIAQLYDGVDDGMATAAFSAGTLINGMDCMIAVRRDSAASCVAGLYNGIADATKFFGMAESASGSGCVGSGAGTPTVWVDNTQLTGGTAVTRGTLHTALTVGDWHILEFRNLDLSTWTAAGFGLYTSYLFPGPRGDILLYPSTDPTEDKDAARQWLADYYGVTLP